MADDTLPVQAAVVARLRAHAPLTALATGGVHDEAPANAVFPFVTLGPTVAQPFEAQGLDGWEVSLTVDTWSRGFGAVELRRLMAEVYTALHMSEIAVTGRALVMARLSDQRDLAPDARGLRHGVQRFDIITHS